ncbi:AMP-binding protein [Sulfitobacter porphyrae]|uniref:AMP-binding protein n=1 Tax=Sulfitobacter porphyrae TaxID=1246864 RepID=A0ABW2BA71_9RHOB
MNTETVYTRFKSTAAMQGDAPFLHVLEETAQVYGIPQGDISYDEMAQRVEGWRNRFMDAGYGAGHRVGLLLENRPVFLEIWLALNAIGASVVPINPDLRLAELEYLAEHSEMILAIVLSDRLEEMKTAVENAHSHPCHTARRRVAKGHPARRGRGGAEHGDGMCLALYLWDHGQAQGLHPVQRILPLFR